MFPILGVSVAVGTGLVGARWRTRSSPSRCWWAQRTNAENVTEHQNAKRLNRTYLLKAGLCYVFSAKGAATLGGHRPRCPTQPNTHDQSVGPKKMGKIPHQPQPAADAH
jgi:hypothetical protein